MLVAELSYPTYRGPLTSLYNSIWQFGAFFAAWTTFGSQYIHSTWAWRLPSILQGLPAMIQIFLVWFMPESPRWLVSKGRDAQAIETLAYYHADGNAEDPLVIYEYNEIKAAIDFDRTVAANVGWLSLFTKRSNRKRMRIILAIAFFSQWSGNGLVSYYLTKVFNTIGITDPVIQLLINAILQLWNVFWTFGASFLVERVGRRPLFIISSAGMLVFFTLQTVCSALFAQHGNPASAHAVIAFIFIYYAFYDIAFSPLLISYTIEILPFSVRAKGHTMMSLTVSVAIIFNQYVNPIALDAIAWKYYIVYDVLLVFELLFVWLYIVETKGLSLEETAALFEDEDAAKQITGHTDVVPASPNVDEKASVDLQENYKS